MSDDPAVDGKMKELAQVARRALRELDESANFDPALDIVRNFAAVRPPEVDTSIRLVTMTAGGVDGGQSVKPGNITLNMRKLVTAIAGGVITTVGALQVPWTAVFAALLVWDSLWSAATVDLSEVEASVLWTLWQVRDNKGTVPDAGLLHLVNTTRNQFGRSELSKQELNAALEKLVRIDTIERDQGDGSRWWLREWVRPTYT